MSADSLIQVVTQGLFVLIFLIVLRQAVRQPLRANIDIALLFAMLSLVIALSLALRLAGIDTNRWIAAASGSVIMALPYLMLRLVDDFAVVPRPLMRLAEGGLVLAVLGLFLIEPPLPDAVTLPYVLYFFGFEVYAALVFVRTARTSSGVTQRRMQAIATGSVLLGAVILFAGFQAAVPAAAGFWTVAANLAGLASGISYFFGFAPPTVLRRAWQEPELRAFLGRAASLPRLPTTAAIVQELEQGAAASLGAPSAAIGLWNDDIEQLEFTLADGRTGRLDSGQMVAGRAYATQRALYVFRPERADPEHADAYRSVGAQAIVCAPITAGDRRLGVLVIYAPRAPIFAEDDLVLGQLLADQAAVILESRALIDEAGRVRAQEEALRLKDDFLSAAAHDLKTPLTTLLGQAQLMERRALRDPAAPVQIEGVRQIISETRRLNTLVMELLDASRLEQGKLLGPREPVDLVSVAREVCGRHTSARHPCTVAAGVDCLVGQWDPVRVSQVVENLVENAVKYSPDGGAVRIDIWQENGDAGLSVTDQGIGIPRADVRQVFDRFHRGANVNDRTYAGMGLGLFICRGIIEQHGGRIWVESKPGQGSTFHVRLPLTE